MEDLLFGSTREHTAAVRAAARAAAVAFVAEQRALLALFAASRPEHREFVHGEIACLLHVSPATGAARLDTALALGAQPRLLVALEHGQLGVPHALALLAELSHLDPPHAAAVLAAVLGDTPAELDRTPGELRAAAKRAAIVVDPSLARRRHEAAKKTAGVRGRPGIDGMGQVVVTCTATEMATALAALHGQGAALRPQLPGLTQGQREVAAFLQAIGADQVRVQAVIECPVDPVTDLPALAAAPVWTVDVRMPAAVALGLSDHPAVLRGYGPLDADQARLLLPAADLVRACVDSTTGEVLTADPPARPPRTTRRRGPRHQERQRPRTPVELRDVLVHLATSGDTIRDLSTDQHDPGAALGRLVDLRDVTSTFPGDLTPAHRTDQDHRLPFPLGRTDPQNLQCTSRRWHRAKHHGWRTRLLDDGTIRWTSPGGGTYDRPPRRTPPPPLDRTTLPGLMPGGPDPARR